MGASGQVADRSLRSRWWVRVPLGLLVLVIGYLLVTAAQVMVASGRDEKEASDAIIVLGAAQYDGTPSPALQRRLDHALELYEQGLAPQIVLTGSKQPEDRFTEAFAGFRYLTSKGVSEDSLRLVDDGSSTWESLAAAWRVLRKDGVKKVLLVSDPYHHRRLQGIAGELGMEAYVSSGGRRPNPGEVLGETARVATGQIIGYRRLFNLTG